MRAIIVVRASCPLFRADLRPVAAITRVRARNYYDDARLQRRRGVEPCRSADERV